MGSKMEAQLKELPEMLNLVLIQTGKILRDTNLHTPQNAILASRRISEFVTPANEAFNNALNDIEVEILQAKAAIDRDLSIIRKRRAERDREAGRGLKGSSSPQKPPEPSLLSGQTDQIQRDGESEDAIMVDANLLSDNPNPDLIDMKELSNVLGNGDSSTLFDNMPQDAQNSSGLAISLTGQKETQDASTTAESTDPTAISTQIDPATLTQPTDQSKETSDFDFDSMFNDVFTGTSNDIGLGDSTTAISNDNNVLGDANTMPGFDLGSAAGLSAPTNEDINSLLPGLENFVNGPNDTTVTNPDTNLAVTAAELTQQSANDTVDNNDSQPVSNQIGTDYLESSFDDLFGSMGNAEGEQMDGDLNMLDGDINLEPFDDDWFKTDK